MGKANESRTMPLGYSRRWTPLLYDAHPISPLGKLKGTAMKTRILIIDNEPRWIDYARSELSSKFEIIVARDVQTAVAELEVDRFDLVIVSSCYLAVLGIIRERFAHEHVVIMTIQPSTQEALSAYRLGAIRYLPKSFGRLDLYSRVKDVISVPASVK
jgi:DNA-binding NtrC family response regulator